MTEIDTRVCMLENQVEFLMNLLGVDKRTVNRLNHKTGETWTSIELREGDHSRLNAIESGIERLSKKE